MTKAFALVLLTMICLPQVASGQKADCNSLASDLVIKNLQASWSDNSKLLFLSNLTQIEPQASKEALDRSGKISVGLITVGPGSWGKEKQDQLRSELRTIVNIEQLKQSAASVVLSSGDFVAANAVQDCLTSREGLYLSFYDLGKDTAVAELMWTASPGSKESATIDGVTVVHGKIVGGGTFAKEGAELQDRLKQRITIERSDAKQDVFVIVNTKNVGSTQAYLPPSELPLPAPKLVRATIEGKQIVVGSGAYFDGGRNPGCQSRQAQACVQPQHGGKIVSGSGRPRIINQSGRAGVNNSDSRETPQEYCVTFWASTGACETPVSISGVATAVEEYAVDE